MDNIKIKDSEMVAIIEGFLFIAGEKGLTLEELSFYLNFEKKKNKTLEALEKLKEKLENDNNSGLTIIKVGDYYKLTTKNIHHNFYQTLKDQPLLRLSQAALETLAIIAYNQPVTKPKIEEIRGVNCDGIINKLKSLNFIDEAGRSELPGRPFLYQITNEFMDHFQIESLNQLPELPNFELNKEEQEFYNYDNEH